MKTLSIVTPIVTTHVKSNNTPIKLEFQQCMCKELYSVTRLQYLITGLLSHWNADQGVERGHPISVAVYAPGDDFCVATAVSYSVFLDKGNTL